MSRYLKFLCIVFLLISGVHSSLAANNVERELSMPSSLARWASLLGWAYTPDNLCCGYFAQPPEISAYPVAAPFKTTQMIISATGLTRFAQTGPSTLEDNVTLTQPGREIAADKATLYRNEQTGKISEIHLQGGVRYREPGKMLLGKTSHINLEKNTLTLDQGAFNAQRPTDIGLLYSWGLIHHGFRNPQGTLFLDEATYTTCSPLNPSWYLEADKLTLNKITGRGVARNAWLYAGSWPILYTPYANFPIDKRRYSGFLYPSFGYNQNSGFNIDIPYYFNLAPNYDETVTASPMTQRGLLMTSLFRYLTPTSHGDWLISAIPNDRGFAHFKQQTLEIFPPTFLNDPYLDNLASDSDNRAALALHDDTLFSEKWAGALDVNYVTDDYFLRDFGDGPQQITTDQLLNQAQVTYRDEHWQFLAQLQIYQTLHLIDDTFVADQYRRLPQIDLAANYPDSAWGLDYSFNSEWVNFQHLDDFFTGQQYPTGNRVHINPEISRSFAIDAGYITPSLQLDSTSYSVINNAVVDNTTLIPIFFPTDEKNLNLTRALPIFNIDAGLFLDRDFRLGRRPFKQTLEPRLFYLYVPTRNQFDIPLFDTNLPSFSANQLFRTNRFVGYDRLGDANQISLGITSRILDGFTGEEKLDATIGEIFYFHKHTVCLYPNCSDDPTINDRVSPIAGQLNFHPNSKWTGTAAASWDPNHSQLNNIDAHFIYTPAPQHIFKFGYDYVQNGDVLNPAEPNSHENNLQRLNLGAAWSLNEHWNLLADWNYNLSHRHPQTYLYGLEYDTCCWSVRFVSNRTLSTENNNGQTTYQTNYYIQFMLKGLGTVGNNNAGNVLINTFPGYFDKYR